MKALIIGLLALASVSQAKPSVGFKIFLPRGQIKESPKSETADQAVKSAHQPEGFKMLLPGGQLRESSKSETLDQAVQSVPKPGSFKMILPGGQVQESQKSEKVESGPEPKVFRNQLSSGGVRSDKSSAAEGSLKKDFFQLFPSADEAEQVNRAKRDASNPVGFHMYPSDVENAKALPGAVPFLPSHPRRRRRRRRSITKTEKPAVNDSLPKDLPNINLQVYQEANESCGCGCGTTKEQCSSGKE